MKLKNTILLLLTLFIFMGMNAQKIDDCNSSFTYNKVLSISPLTINFTDLSTSTTTIQEWKWTFGDGEYSQKQNPEHQYTNAGAYIVKLEIIDNNNIWSQYIDTIELIANIKTVCSAKFNYRLLYINPSFIYGFMDYSIAVNDSIISWEWDFGDGGISTSQNTIHNYISQGNYTVILKITTASLANYYYTQNIVVSGLKDPCNVDFSYVEVSPLTLSFLNFSQSDYPVISWHWDFGDGDTSNISEPTHEYPYDGIYNVSLTMTSANCTDNINIQIQVGNPQFHSIWGRVYAGNFTIDQCKAYLYQQFNTSIVLKDTIELCSINDSLGIYYFYQIPEGNYYIKVDIPSTSNYFGDYCPTYFGDSPLWNQSQIMQVFSDKNNQHINLTTVNHQNGTNYISGNITNTANGEIEDILTLLYDSNNDLLDFTHSDSNGNYSFSNVPTGEFSIYGELIGFTAYPATTPLLNNNDSINVDFFIENTTSVGVIQNDKEEKELLFNIYPNPAYGNNIMLIIDIEQYQILNYRITNTLGIEIKNGELYNHKNSISIDNISKGMFFITIFDKNNVLIGTKKLIFQ